MNLYKIRQYSTDPMTRICECLEAFVVAENSHQALAMFVAECGDAKDFNVECLDTKLIVEQPKYFISGSGNLNDIGR